jgi:hypothetical protein
LPSGANCDEVGTPLIGVSQSTAPFGVYFFIAVLPARKKVPSAAIRLLLAVTLGPVIDSSCWKISSPV